MFSPHRSAVVGVTVAFVRFGEGSLAEGVAKRYNRLSALIRSISAGNAPIATRHTSMSTQTDWPGTAEMIRRVNTAKGRESTGLYSIEGTRLVERAVRAGATLETVLMSHSFSAQANARTQELLADLAAAGIVTVIAPDSVLHELTGGRQLGEVLGLVRRPSPPSLEDVSAASAAPGLYLAGVDILDPGNAGALVRTAHAAGARAFLAVGTTDPYHPRATRISRGSILRLPVVAFASAEALMAALHRSGIRSVATAATGGIALPAVAPLPGPSAVLMGNEGQGLPEAVQRAVDLVVTIPMPDGVDSFAVNAAAAIVLYEFQRAARSATGHSPG